MPSLYFIFSKLNILSSLYTACMWKIIEFKTSKIFFRLREFKLKFSIFLNEMIYIPINCQKVS